MRTIKFNISHILFYILLFLPIYQDSHLYYIFGSYGHAPVAIISILIFFYCLFKKKIIKNPFFIILKKLIFIILLITSISTIIYCINNKSIYYLSENLITKSFRGPLFFISISAYIVSFVSLGNTINVNNILKSYKNIFILLFIIMIIEALTLPNAFSFLHATRPYNYYRIRLLSSEASWTTTIIILYYILALAYCIKNSKIYQIYIYTIILLLFIVFSSSKSLLICIMLLFILLALFEMKQMTKNKLLIYLIGIIILLLGINLYNDKVISLFEADITNSTSFSTRIFSIYTGIKLFLKNPLGYGTSIYFPAIREAYINNLNIFSKFKWFNSRELIGLIVSKNDTSLAIKSGFFQYSLYWGIIGTLLFIKFFIKLYVSINKLSLNVNEKNIYKVGIIIMLIYIIFVSSFDYKFELWSFISYIILLINKNASRGEAK